MNSLNAEASSHGKPKRLLRKSTLLFLLAALTAAFLFSPPLQAQGGPAYGYVDLVMTHEYDGSKVAYSVQNIGTATAYGVTVSFHLKDLDANDADIESPGISDKRTDDATKEQWFKWAVGTIPPGSASEDLTFSTSRHSGYDGFEINQLGVITARASSNQFERPLLLANNELKLYSFVETTTGSSRHMDGNELALVLYVDDLRPDAEDDVNFGLTAVNKNGQPLSFYSNLIGDIEVKVELSHGLEFKAGWDPPDTFVKSGSRSATWSPPYTHGSTQHTIPQFREIEIATQLTSDSLDDIPLGERCITAWVADSTPPPSPDYALGRLTRCLGDVPTVLLNSGRIDLVSPFRCVNVDYPCQDSDGDSVIDDELEMVASSLPDGLGPFAEGTRSGRHPTTHVQTLVRPELTVVQIKDPVGRRASSGNIVWNSGSQSRGGRAVGLFPGVILDANLPTRSLRGTYSFSISDMTPGGKPGSIKAVAAISKTITVLDADRASQPTWSRNLTSPALPLWFEFGELGTYKVNITIGHSVGSASGVYTFHVGPVAELEAVGAWQTGRRLEIAAVNHGPDHSQGTRAMLDNGQTCDFGVFPPGGGDQTAIRTCIIPEAELAELTPEQLAGKERIGYIENHVDYTVCIDSSGDDVLPKPAGESACEDEGGTWHTAAVYDYNNGNNDIYLSQAPPPTALSPSSPRTRTITSLVIRWQRLDNLLGSPVSHYQVERLDNVQAAQWQLLADVPQTAPGVDPEYEDIDQDRGSSPRYRVRAVNEEGLASPWSERGGSQPGVVLKLDKTTIKEPEGDPGPEATATVTATLNGPVSSRDVNITVSAEPEGDDSFTLGDVTALTIPAGKRESTGAVTIRAKTDVDSDNEQVSIKAAAANARCTTCSLTLKIDDKDNPGLTLKPAQVTLTENSTSTDAYTVTLDAAPADPGADVVISLTSNNADVTVQPAELAFTSQDWDQPQPVTVTAGEDADAANDTATITHRIVDGQSDAAYHPVADVKAEVTVTDDDMAGVTVDASDPITVAEGETGSYTLKLDTEPTSNVVIAVTSGDPAVTVNPASLTFGRSNWDRPQTVTVRAVQDDNAEYETVTLSHEVVDNRSADEYDDVANIDDVTVRVLDDEAPADYDLDDDGLLDITTQAQLSALRWDLDGNGKPDAGPAGNEDKEYRRAFPRMMAGSCGEMFTETAGEGDPNTSATPCTGYELMNDITLSGNWTPIGGNLHFDDYETPLEEYKAEFDGNGHVISNLRINRSDGRHVGLFGATGGGAVIRNVGLENANVRGRFEVGVLVGRNFGGQIEHAWSTGQVFGVAHVGGLVGTNYGSIKASYSGADVTGFNGPDQFWSTRIAGLVGTNYSLVENTYATGRVRGRGHVAGLVGENSGGGRIVNSYATGAVSTEEDWPFKAGLVGWQLGQVQNSYWDTETSGQSRGVAQGHLSGAAGKKTTELQGPTAATLPGSIYHQWDPMVWDFGTRIEYPTLKPYEELETSPQQRAPDPEPSAEPGRVRVGTTNMLILETQPGATYVVELDVEPTENVVITVSSSNPAAVTVEPASLTFTPDNWQTAQGVTVTPLQDEDEDDETATITHTASGGNYDDIAVGSVSVTVNDFTIPAAEPGVTVSAADPLVLEEGGTVSYQVSLDAQPSADVTVAVDVAHSEVTAQPTSLTFTADNWQTAQTVTLSAAHDPGAGDETATITHAVSGAEEYAGLTVASVNLVIADDDTPGVRISVPSLDLDEGGADTYQVSLLTRPTHAVTISVSSDNPDVEVEPATLTFHPVNWDTVQTITVSAKQDDDGADDAATISHTVNAAGDYLAVVADPVAVTVTDDEPTAQPATEAGRVSVSATELPIREGDPSATYTVVLDAEPTENVVIAVSSDNADVTVQPASLTFTPDNWPTAQTVTVSVSQDTDEVNETATLSHSASGGNYEGVAVSSVTVSVTDDDSDREVLRDFYNATGGDGWTNKANWLSGQPLGQWHGVTVNGQGQVTAIVLDGNNLTGSLPIELGKLESLTRLAMNRNNLTGAIPSQLGSLSSLSIIGLARNNLSGALPASLGNLSGLTKVSLHDNTGLSGELPAGFGSMSGLTRLAISRTGLSGSLPQGLVNNTVMQYLHFDATSLCAPANEEFQTWLDGVPDKSGTTCQ